MRVFLVKGKINNGEGEQIYVTAECIEEALSIAKIYFERYGGIILDVESKVPKLFTL